MRKTAPVGAHAPGKVLAIPRSAVLSTGTRHLVYVQSHLQRDAKGELLLAENGKPITLDLPEYYPFEVQLGPLANEYRFMPDGTRHMLEEYYPLIGAIPTSVRIVTKGQFFIDSQMELMGKPSLLRAEGGRVTNPHAGH